MRLALHHVVMEVASIEAIELIQVLDLLVSIDRPIAVTTD